MSEDLGNLEHFMERLGRSCRAAKFESCFCGRCQSFEPVVINGEGSGSVAGRDAQQGDTALIERAQVNLADDGQSVGHFQVVGGSIAQPVADQQGVPARHVMCSAADAEFNAVVGLADPNFAGEDNGHGHATPSCDSDANLASVNSPSCGKCSDGGLA